MRLNLSLKAEKLHLHRSRKQLNPYCKLIFFVERGEYVDIGQSETIYGTKHPCWLKNFQVDFEISQEIFVKAQVYHEVENDADKLIVSCIDDRC